MTVLSWFHKSSFYTRSTNRFYPGAPRRAPFIAWLAENQITTSKQTAFCDRILKTHRTTPSKVALFASS